MGSLFTDISDREERAIRARIKEREPSIVVVRTPQPMKRGQETRAETTTARGVYEAEIALTGHRAFHIVNSRGEVGFVQFPTAWVTRGFVRRLLHELDRQDQTQLRLVKPGP